MKRWFLCALAGILLTHGWSGRATGFERTLTCRQDANPEVDPLACRPGQNPVPIYWPRDCVAYHVHEGGSADIGIEAVLQAIRSSFDTWNEPECSFLQLIEGGLTNEDRIGYYSCDPRLNANILVFRTEDWGHQRAALALTSVTFNSATGEIVDADVEFNDEWFTFSTTDQPALIRNDIQNTLTHEVGHFLGLDHTDDEECTMYGRAPMGETKKRTLEQDDIDGLCAIYPVGEATGQCDTSTVGFFTRPEPGPGESCPDDHNSCDCSLGTNGREQVGPLLLLGLVALAIRRRVTGSDYRRSKG